MHRVLGQGRDGARKIVRWGILSVDGARGCVVSLTQVAGGDIASDRERVLMAQIFRPRANSVFRAMLLGFVLLVAGAGWVGYQVERSSYVTRAGIVVEQPVPFSHEHHVRGLGIDCRYCHTSVTASAFAGMPSTKTCITCHSQIWTNAGVLEPVRRSWDDDVPIRWNRVHNLPGYVYFDHSIHVAKGVGCATCHGPVDEMPLMYQFAPLTMAWCLDCHRHPEEHLRPREAVFDMSYRPPADQRALGRELAERYEVRSAQALTDCATCHR